MKKKSCTFSAYWKEFVPKSWSCLQNYSLSLFKNDLIAGITVGIVALPLAMAFAIASGVSPERGLYTTIVAGFLISLLGGSRLQIGGPTGAFVVIIYDIVQRLGYSGLVMATLMAGVILLIVAFSRFGRLIKYVPYPLIIGFTTGIAVIIFSSQVKDFLGLTISQLPADFIPKWTSIFSALPSMDFPTFWMSLGTLFFIIFIRKFLPVIPWGIAAVIMATLVSSSFHLPLETIASRFGSIPRTLPLPQLPHFALSLTDIHRLIPDAITIAFLAGIESLLSAVVADGMAGTHHRSNGELMAQGVANIGSVIFGGIPATGAIARTATNVKTGGKTPLAGMIHAMTVLLIVMAFAPIVSQIPLAALSAILMMVAWNMSELHHFRHLFKAPTGDVIVLLATFLTTVLVDLTVAVLVGVLLSLFVFMRKMETVSGVATAKEDYQEENGEVISKKHLPSHVEIFEITGPFFFGVADSLKHALLNIEKRPKVFILKMNQVPWIDASGLHALREFHYQCHKEGTVLILVGVKKSVYETLKKFGLVDLIGKKYFFSSATLALKQVA